jgi:cell filamentation protein
VVDRNHDPYVYAGTDVLKNKFGIRDSTALNALEADISTLRMIELLEQPPPKKFTFNHLLSIHALVFGDVYPWVGMARSIDITKGSSVFCRAPFIHAEAENICLQIEAASCFKGLSEQAFVTQFSGVFNEMNVVHPFREGNGRVTRLFFNQVAAKAGYQIDYGHMTPEQWVSACIAGYHLDLSQLETLLGQALVPFM